MAARGLATMHFMLVSVAVAGNEAEAQMICTRLAGAGIVATQKRSSGMDVPQLGAGGARDIYVDGGDEQRARAALADQDVSEEELARLSDQFEAPED